MLHNLMSAAETKRKYWGDSRALLRVLWPPAALFSQWGGRCPVGLVITITTINLRIKIVHYHPEKHSFGRSDDLSMVPYVDFVVSCHSRGNDTLMGGSRVRRRFCLVLVPYSTQQLIYRTGRQVRPGSESLCMRILFPIFFAPRI